MRRLSVAGDRAPADRAVTSGPLYLTQGTMTENSPRDRNEKRPPIWRPLGVPRSPEPRSNLYERAPNPKGSGAQCQSRSSLLGQFGNDDANLADARRVH